MVKIVIQDKELGNIKSSLDYFIKFNIPKNAKILEVGCNYGSLIYNLSKLGYKNAQGIDVNSKAIKKGKSTYKKISKRINHYSGNKIPFKTESFDVILMFDVIEHIPRIQDFLKNDVNRILKKGGTFIFQTPNKYINIPWEIVNNKSFSKWKSYHCSLQTKNSLKNTLKKSNFKNIVIEKGEILTEHNKKKVRKRIPVVGIILLYLSSLFPLSLNPNLWGSGKR